MSSSMKFGSEAPRCQCCNERVYKLEELQVDKAILHKSCFKCTHCKRLLSLSNFASVNGKFYCKTHFIELFHSAGGKYSVFGDGDFKKKETGAEKFAEANKAEEPKSVASVASKPLAAKDTAPPPDIPLVQKGSTWVRNSGEDTGTVDSPSLTDHKGSTDEPSGKYRSLRDRLKEYEKVASSSGASGSDGEGSSRRVRSSSAGSVSSITSAPIAEAAEETNENVASEDNTILREVEPSLKNPKEVAIPVLSSSSTLKDIADDESAEEELSRLRLENSKLQQRVQVLTSENEKLHSGIVKLKGELAVQTAKALEADEWCAKLSKDYEAVRGAPPPAVSSLLKPSK